MSNRGVGTRKTKKSVYHRFRLRGSGSIKRWREGHNHNTGKLRPHVKGRRAKSVTLPSSKIEKKIRILMNAPPQKQRWKKNPHILVKAGKDVQYFRNRIKELHNRQGTAQVVAAATAASSYKRLVSEVEKDSLISVS
uniref:50S ribosomal protein L35 n=1 Tax=Grammatophora oceanica TaxID=210454 RepID=A0A7S1Y349_9STRA|mmetsp:Transcript_20417/g.30263  ORF Transcript_20417/g.30263 Transcript_20417/m.30263 type:complete len:137 (+) Transcript_20417:692-1102(+)